jgi:predicted NUDIX family phosphoesterase
VEWEGLVAGPVSCTNDYHCCFEKYSEGFNWGDAQGVSSVGQRGVAEEVSIETKYKDKVVALLNDDSNEVGQVHLGIVHLWTLDEPKVNRKEQMITQMGFMSIPELQLVCDTMETWSQLCLDGLANI